MLQATRQTLIELNMRMQGTLGTRATYSLDRVPPDSAFSQDMFDTLLFCISDLSEFSEYQASNAPVPVMEDTGLCTSSRDDRKAQLAVSNGQRISKVIAIA